MLRRILHIFLFSMLIVGMALSHVQPAGAQVIDGNTFESGVVTFFNLGEDELNLNGPFDSTRITFGIPSNWNLTGDAELEIFLGVSFSNLETGETTNLGSLSGGSLTVIMNDFVLGAVQLSNVGEFSTTFKIPLDALQSRRDDGLMQLDLVLETGFDCDFSQSTLVIVHSSSRFTLPHEIIALDTNFINFPRPLYSRSFVPDSVIVVLPDQPTSGEVQAALTLGAGLTNLTGSGFNMSLLLASQLTPELQEANHLIFIGTPGSLSGLLSQVILPSSIENDLYQIAGIEAEDGVIQMVRSPWSEGHVILVVSGNDDVGVQKAAQVITSGVIRSGPFSNVSVVKEIQPILAPSSIPVDFSLADLGYSTEVMDSRGSTSFTYEFNVPPGKAVASDAYFELAYGHSALLNFDQSGVIVLLNDQPIGSIKLSKETAAQPVNLSKINIPPSLVQIGINRIDVLPNVVPFDICTLPDISSEWITVWSESRFHLPLSDPLTISPTIITDLSDYPAPFINHPALDTTAFVLEPNDIDALRASFNIASYLGNSANGQITLLKVFYSDQITEADYPLYNFIVVGRPSDSKFIELINDELPAPFDLDSNIAIEKNMQATFLIPPDVPIGYIELMPSPWEKNNVIVTALGNSPQGTLWAGRPLGDSPLGSSLLGNFAVINDQKILTTDTRLAPISTLNILPGTPDPVAVQPISSVVPETPVPYSQNNWIPVVLVILAVLTLFTLAAVGYSSWINNRTRNKTKNINES